MLQELNELTSGSETVNDSAVISEQRAGAVDGTGAAAAVTRSVQGVRAADTSAQTLGEAFNILTTHDTRLNSINAKLDELLVFVRELVTNKSGAQGNESQISVGGSGGATLRGRGSGHQQQQQPQQTEGGGGNQGTQQQPRAAFETPDRRGHQADQQQQQPQQQRQRAEDAAAAMRPEQQQQHSTAGAGRTVQRGERWGPNTNYEMLQRQREQRGPFMILFNLPEERQIMPEMQRTKDLEDVKYVVSYIEEGEGERVLSNNIIDVVRLGRKTEGKHRPIRVQFTGQLYRDAAVRRGFRIRYLTGDDVLNKVVMCKDRCREDREAAKAKYEEKKRSRIATVSDGSSAAAANGNQVPPQDASRNSQGTRRDNASPPQMEGQQGAP